MMRIKHILIITTSPPTPSAPWHPAPPDPAPLTGGQVTITTGGGGPTFAWRAALRGAVEALDEGLDGGRGLRGGGGAAAQTHALTQRGQVSFHRVHVVVHPAPLLVLPAHRKTAGLTTSRTSGDCRLPPGEPGARGTVLQTNRICSLFPS